MAPELSINYPVINFCNIDLLLPGSPEWESTKQQVDEAFEEYGFFEAEYDKVPVEIFKQVYASCKELLDLRMETKLARNKTSRHFRAYIPPIPGVSFNENIAVGEASDVEEEIEAFTNSMWSQGNASFCKVVFSYVQQLTRLDRVIRLMVLENLGFEKYVDEHLMSSEYNLFMIRYQTPGIVEPTVGAGKHTDMTFLSVLSQYQSGGLQIQAKNGQWMDIKPCYNKFAVFMGDSFHSWTNGRTHAAYHRVIISEPRYSIGLFTAPKAGYIVNCPEEFVDEEHPRLFKPYDHLDYQRFYHTQEGLALCSNSPLKAFAGV